MYPPKLILKVWLKAKTKHDGTEYYAYVLVYVDDVLHQNHDPDTLINRLAEVYRIKYGSVGEPDRYLDANIEKVQLDDGSVAWSMTSREYVTNSIKNLEDALSRDGAHPLNIFGKEGRRKAISIDLRSQIRRITVK